MSRRRSFLDADGLHPQPQLLCVALLLLSSLSASLGASSIRQLMFDAPNCTGDAFINTTLAVSGECRPFRNLYSTAMYCSLDGSTVFTYYYEDMDCTDARWFKTERITNRCAAGTQHLCENALEGPPPPHDGSPSHWLQSTACKNAETGEPILSCDPAEPNAWCSITWTKLAACVQRNYPQAGPAATSTERAYCSEDGSMTANVLFSDLKCGAEGGQLVKAVLQQTGCHAGVRTVCPVAQGDFKPPIPPPMPRTGIRHYGLANPSCARDASSAAPTLTLWSTDECIDGQKFRCVRASNSSDAPLVGQLRTWNDPTKMGVCGAGPLVTIAEQEADVCSESKEYLCDYNDGIFDAEPPLQYPVDDTDEGEVPPPDGTEPEEGSTGAGEQPPGQGGLDDSSIGGMEPVPDTSSSGMGGDGGDSAGGSSAPGLIDGSSGGADAASGEGGDSSSGPDDGSLLVTGAAATSRALSLVPTLLAIATTLLMRN